MLYIFQFNCQKLQKLFRYIIDGYKRVNEFNIDYGLGRRIISTCDQTMAPAKNARVCIISFSAFSPTLLTNSPDFCRKI